MRVRELLHDRNFSTDLGLGGTQLVAHWCVLVGFGERALAEKARAVLGSVAAEGFDGLARSDEKKQGMWCIVVRWSGRGGAKYSEARHGRASGRNSSANVLHAM